MRSLDTFTALNRFGVGAGPGDDARAGDDPRGWLLEQIRPGQALPPGLRRFRSAAQIRAEIAQARLESNEARNRAVRRAMSRDFRPEVMARLRYEIRTPDVLPERMVRFWANHFTASLARGARDGVTIPAYEREAIRPHIFGRFRDMLHAAARNPTLLTYLDNVFSVGPDSPAGQNRQRRRPTATTLNENFARELLELHTLGVDGGYTQDDIIEAAKIFTGWGHGGYRRGGDEPIHGNFQFVRRQHQPGPKTVLGRVYEGAGEAEGLRLLDDLARHPSTARHIATKLVRHFVADIPPPDAIAQIERVFRDTDGDLAQVTRALVMLDAAWADPLAKVKTPHEFVVACFRATGSLPERQPDYFQPMRLLAMLPHSAPSPAGWSDRAADWLGPEALMIRLEWARGFAARQPGTLVPAEVLDRSIGAAAREVTTTWVERAPSGDAALAMILSSPEFQRR